jgi:hypothetical protein
MGTKWTNSDGLTLTFGRRDVAGGVNERPLVRAVNRSGSEQELIVDFDFNHLGSAESAAPTEWWDEDASGGIVPDRPSNQHARIPANATLESATLYVKTAFAGATANLNLGLYQADATAIDVDGIDAAIDILVIDADGDVVACDGVLIGADVGAADAFIGAHADTGAFTAGEARLVVRYTAQRP